MRSIYREPCVFAVLLVAVSSSGPKLQDIESFHWQSGLSGPGDAQGGHSWYQRAVSLLQYDREDEGQFTTRFGAGGAWLSRSGMHDPKDVCPCLNFKCCQREQDKSQCGWLFESFEGGSGYNANMRARTPKWRVGDSTGCYSAYTQAPMFHSGDYVPHACSWAESKKVNKGAHQSAMGLVQLSNRLMLIPDGQTFEEMGMFGVAYARTPFGKINAKDSRNFWTLIYDSANYAGPVAYFLPEFWGLREKGNEAATAHFKDFSTVPLIGMSGPAWECQAMQSIVDGGVLKLSKMSFPYRNGRSVLWMGQRAHADSDIMDPLEKALASGKLDPSQLLANGRAPSCKQTQRPASFGNAATWGTSSTSLEHGDCVWSVTVANSSCPANGMCALPEYYQNKRPVNPSKASAALRSKRFPTEGNPDAAYDALNTSPHGGCRDSPGPATQTLYCAKTVDSTWLAYRWYRFVDQPAMQQLQLSDAEKDFMQARVTTLHKMVPTAVSKWINGRHAEAEGLASVDSAAIASPPKGMEHGFVPIILYQGYKKPGGCASTPVQYV